MDEDYAYKMGLDCVMNGPNTTNCNFAIFAKPEWSIKKRKTTCRAVQRNSADRQSKTRQTPNKRFC